jgi:predicted P-loop ATPase
VERVPVLFIRYGGAEDTKLNRETGKLFMVGLCRRVRQSGAKFDEMITLEGLMGRDKSTFLEILAFCEEWFSDSFRLNKTDDRKVIEQVQ